MTAINEFLVRYALPATSEHANGAYVRFERLGLADVKYDDSRKQTAEQSPEIIASGDRTIKIVIDAVAQSSSLKSKVLAPHPQDALTTFWRTNFDPEYLGKITRILPSSLVEPRPAILRPLDESSHASPYSYDHAKARCIRDINRIVRECRALNKRYTDTHFDIERDLKITRRRDCLDGLHNTLVSGTADWSVSGQPHDVKRVSEIFGKPTFFGNGASSNDIVQGKLGDCWLLAAMSVLTCNKQLVHDICVVQEPEVGVYGFVFYRDGEWHQTIIDDKLYLRAPSYDESGDVVLGMYGLQHHNQEESYTDLFQRGSKSLFFGQCSDANETWVPLLEKAFAKAHGSYAALIGGQTGEAIEDLTGGVTTEIYTTNILNKDKFWYEELCKIGKHFVFSAAVASYREWRGGDAAIRAERRQGIVSAHAYAVLATYEGHGQRLVKMRNPWGSSEWSGPWSDGSKEWNSDWFERLNHKFGDDGVFWISYDDLLRKYKYLDRTRIFGPGWHVATQWTSCQVPWNTTDYQQTRFAIEVPERTDAVIVLQQLDDRYFEGLQGKYNYYLQFRVQKEDGTDEEYFARSSQNYELRRSNNVEVTLEKGRYTVLFKVEARKTNRKDVEAVIKENIWRKEKLMTVGTLYDLAHQKGQRNQPKPKPTVPSRAEAQSTIDEKADDTTKDPWNAFCVVGLRVYSKCASTVLRVVHPDEDEPASPILDRDDIAKAALEEVQHIADTAASGETTNITRSEVPRIAVPQSTARIQTLHAAGEGD